MVTDHDATITDDDAKETEAAPEAPIQPDAVLAPTIVVAKSQLRLTDMFGSQRRA